ncbi:MAG: VOC family virulence protein [Verrucomicrobia bacterium]|nr:VOC family virulence protein [Verrucomicrobiota bacterium]
MGLPVNFDHCVIHVSDWERSNRFYQAVLGATLLQLEGRRWAYRFGDMLLNLHGPGVKAEPVARIPVQPGGSDLCFEWHGTIDEAIQHLQREQVEIELGPAKRFGVRGEGQSVYFRDPDGSLLELISYEQTGVST